ncbi:MAG: inositol monophosphatase family protein [Bacillota bacterium]
MLQEIEDWAKEVGSFQMKSFQQKIKVASKEQKIDLVTEVDKKSEEMLINKIEKAYPKHSILAEEGGSKKSNSPYRWVIDPLDGTVNYVHGFPIFAISIALLYEDRPEYGLVYLPYFDDVYSASRGEGSFYNEEKMQVETEYKLADAVIATGFPYTHQESNQALEIFSRVLPKVGGIRRTGAAAYDLCQVAKGIFSGFWEIELKPWDIAAGMLLIEEAGGIVTDFAGDLIVNSSSEVVAGSREINSELRHLLTI